MGYIIPHFGLIEQGENCLYSSTRNVLAYHGLRLTESEVYFAFNGLNSVFYPALQKYGFLDIVGHLEHHLLPERLKVRRGKPGPASAQDLLAVLRRDLPVSIVMRAKDATYSKTLESSGAPGRHVSVLYGLDVEQDTAYVWDNYILNKIRKVSHYSGGSSFSRLQPGILEYFWIEVFSRDVIDFSALLCKSLSDFLDGKPRGETVTGEKGLLEYLNSITAFLGDAKQLRDKSYEIYFTLRVSTFEAFLTALTNILKKCNAFSIPGFAALQSEGEALRNEWNSFAAAFLRCGMKNQPEGIKHLLAGLRETVAVQEDYFLRLIRQLTETRILLHPADGAYTREGEVKPFA